MTALDLYGVVAAASVFLAFYFVRDVGAYIKTCLAVVLGAAIATSLFVTAESVVQGIILVAGIALLAFGLLFVRVMFIRSVSLNMLRSIQSGNTAAFGEDIAGRLRDMRTFRLIQQTVQQGGAALEPADGISRLTTFGRLVSGVTAALYTLLRVKT